MQHGDWQRKWQQSETKWDLGGVHPGLPSLWDYAISHALVGEQQMVWIPGCGAGHEAAYMASQGCVVTACDFVAEAIEKANALYGCRDGLAFKGADALEVTPGEKQHYDLIVDRAMLCALEPGQRASYLESCSARLKEGGLLIGLFFSSVKLASGQEGPPYAIPPVELHQLLGSNFSLVMGQTSSPSAGPAVIEQEFHCIWRKKGGE